ncbi:MAG: hypothetical protein K0S39_5320 [Paenibacillus sp.]|nr:hypothetical protein [Paenibacillus sp.]
MIMNVEYDGIGMTQDQVIRLQSPLSDKEESGGGPRNEGKHPLKSGLSTVVCDENQKALQNTRECSVMPRLIFHCKAASV